MERPIDVVVVGGGIGGIALGITLARAGRRVTVIERKPAGTFRLGESLDWESPILLRRLGVEVRDLVADGKATWKPGAVCTNPSHPRIEAELGFSPLFRAAMWIAGRGKPTIHANREAIDADLFALAVEAGVEIITARVSTVHAERDRVTSVVLADGRVVTGRFFIDATGSAAMFRRVLRIGFAPIGPRKVVIRARFPHPYDGMGTRIRTDDSLPTPTWIWDINVSDSLTDLGVVLAEDDFARLKKALGSLHAVFLHVANKHADLAWVSPLVDETTPLWTCVFQDGVADRSNGSNWMCVGESAFVVDGLLSSGFTSALRQGLNAAKIVEDALLRESDELCPRRRSRHHRKVSAHVRTIDGLIDVLWYRGRIRERWSLLLNVASILFVNFNLNHLHTRWSPRTELGLRALLLLHRTIDALVPRYTAALEWLGPRLGRAAHRPIDDPLFARPTTGSTPPARVAIEKTAAPSAHRSRKERETRASRRRARATSPRR
ncbi:MAG: tryptophan 7-halogenase [Byssovorax sp.]